jgi:hypothetical protein
MPKRRIKGRRPPRVVAGLMPRAPPWQAKVGRVSERLSDLLAQGIFHKACSLSFFLFSWFLDIASRTGIVGSIYQPTSWGDKTKTAARGFRTVENLIAIAYLRMSKLKHLPDNLLVLALPPSLGRIPRCS